MGRNFPQNAINKIFILARIYEDHEFVVENIENWLADSKNKLHFIRRPDKYNFVHTPQHFLLTEKSDLEFPSLESDWDAETKQELLNVCLYWTFMGIVGGTWRRV